MEYLCSIILYYRHFSSSTDQNPQLSRFCASNPACMYCSNSPAGYFLFLLVLVCTYTHLMSFISLLMISHSNFK